MNAESYPIAVREMGYGVSAGFGKAGAAIGTQVFTLFKQLQEKQPLFMSLVVLGFLGLRSMAFCARERQLI
jgi:hypothetical protein